MTELTAFNFGAQEIQVITIKGEPWFVASEPCHVLEIDVNDALKRLDDDEKLSTDSVRTTEIEHIKSKWLVSESGLYSLVLGCRKPIAKPFKKWVTSEVLPAIRKTGSYSVQNLTPGQLLKLQAEALISVELRQKEQEQQLIQHDSRLAVVEKRFDQVDKEIRELPSAPEEVPDRDYRSYLNQLIRNYSICSGDSYQDLWNELYRSFTYTYRINLKVRASNQGIKPLDYAQQSGNMSKLYSLAMKLFSVEVDNDPPVLDVDKEFTAIKASLNGHGTVVLDD